MVASYVHLIWNGNAEPQGKERVGARLNLKEECTGVAAVASPGKMHFWEHVSF